MTDALTATPEGPQTDTLAEQVETPKPQDNQIPQDEIRPEDKTGAAVKKAMDDVFGKEGDKKADTLKDDKTEAKEAKKAEAKPKPEPKAEAEAQDTDTETVADAPEAEPDDQVDDTPKKTTAYRDPPSGFDEAAKDEWEAVPESVRGAVHRRAQEMERGIHKYRQAAEQYESVREYADMAKQHGTDLPTALNRYVTMENTLRQNPMQGLQQVVANLGLTKSDGTPVTLRDVAATIMGQTPDQAASRQEATISQLNNQIAQLQQQIGGFSKHVEQQQEQAKVQTAESEWSAFQRDHPRATELEGPIAEALQMQNPEAYPSMTERLRHAYAVAESLNPSVAHTDAQPLVQTQSKPRAANPAGQKSISGAPSGNEAARKARKISTSDAVKNAMRQMGM